jgi:Ti-type conjugative transfer relaxase TraA
MLMVERRMEEAARALHASRRHGVTAAEVERQLRRAGAGGRRLGEDQQAALRHVLGQRDLAFVVGYAGTGKSTLLATARATWETSGYRVRGAALAGIAAENLAAGSGITSRTLHAWEHAWEQGRELLTRRDVLVVDEAGMVGSRQLERVLSQARAAGAKVVLVGDPEQLQAIEAGAAFRALSERHGWAELRTVRRQRAAWMQEATRELATGRTATALARYEAAGMVHASGTRAAAMARLIARWDHDRREQPGRGQLILAYTRDDVAVLNALARDRLKAAGELKDEVMVRTERGVRALAVGERVMFLRNERGLGVKNGTLGIVRAIAGGKLAVQLDEGGAKGVGLMVIFDLKDYAHLEHGYAATIHKSQGVTVGRSYVLAGRPWDRHGTYVAMTRHTDRVELHYGRDEFRDQRQLAARLERARAKDTTLDYRGEDRAARLEAAAQEAVRAMRQERGRGGSGERMKAAVNQALERFRAQRERSRDEGRGR